MSRDEKKALQKENETLKKGKGKVEAEMKAIQKEKDDLQGKNKRLGKEKEDLQKENETLKKENGKVKAEKKALQKENETLKKGKGKVEADNLQGKNKRQRTGFFKREKPTLGKDNEETQQDQSSSHQLSGTATSPQPTAMSRDKSSERDKKTLREEKEALEKKYDSEKERLVKEKEALQKKYEIYKEEVEADFEELRTITNTCGYVLDREWKTMTEARVNVTLDPNIATPSLTVSEDGSRVRFTGDQSAEWPSVLGREGFTSGRHYWEVEVGEKGYWVLGVSTHPHEKSIPEKPGEGYWLVRLFRGKTCTAVSQGIRSGDQILKLEKICKVWGVYLDHEGGRLSFCNAETRFHIHTLEDSFPGPVYPIFSPGSHDKGPLIIQRVRHTAANFI